MIDLMMSEEAKVGRDYAVWWEESIVEGNLMARGLV